MSGLWHGASWNFVIWGGLHGLYLIFAIWSASFRNKIVHLLSLSNLSFFYKIVQILTVFILVDLAWIFFRAVTFQDAWYVLTHLFSGIGGQLSQLSNADFFRQNVLLGQSRQLFVSVLFCILLMEIVHYFQRNRSLRDWLRHQPTLLRWGIYYVFIMLILLLGVFDQPSQFIYFQF